MIFSVLNDEVDSEFLNGVESEFSKLEDNLNGVGTPFSFRTGSGKHVAVKQSSMAKALSMFGGQDDDDDADAILDKGLYLSYIMTFKKRFSSPFSNGDENRYVNCFNNVISKLFLLIIQKRDIKIKETLWLYHVIILKETHCVDIVYFVNVYLDSALPHI